MPSHVSKVLSLLEDRSEPVDTLDIAVIEDTQVAHREAILTIKQAIRIGSVPEELFDDDGDPDFSPGVLIAERSTGRRSLHIGGEALEVLQEAT